MRCPASPIPYVGSDHFRTDPSYHTLLRDCERLLPRPLSELVKGLEYRIHRHGDLHAAEPPPGATAGTQVSRQSLLTDAANPTARNGRRLRAHHPARTAPLRDSRAGRKAHGRPSAWFLPSLDVMLKHADRAT